MDDPFPEPVVESLDFDEAPEHCTYCGKLCSTLERIGSEQWWCGACSDE